MEGAGRAGRPSGSNARTAFHPSVVLLLDDEGERAAAFLSELLAGLPPAVQSWVELLPARDAGDPANATAFESALAAALARVTMVHLRDDVRRAGYHVGDATPLVLLVGHTTAPALLAAARAAQHVTSRGFPQTIRLALLSDSRPHNLEAARAQDDQARAQPWDELLGWFAAGATETEPPVALCLLYQDYDERNWQWNLQEEDVARLTTPGKFTGPRLASGPLPRRVTGPLAADAVRPAFAMGLPAASTPTGPLSAGAMQVGGPSGPLGGEPGAHAAPEPEDVRYAVAEATFALIASGLVDEPEFREQVRLNMPTVPGGGGEAERRFATLATSRLAFPRAHAEVTCGHYEGAALLADWLRAIEREAPRPPTGRDGRRVSPNPTRGEDAARFIRALREDIEDSEDLEFRRVGESSPPLSAEGISQLYGFERTEVDPARIFAPFRGRSIAREMSATGERVPAALHALSERARMRYLRWHADAEQVWDDAFADRQRAVAGHIEATLLATPAGIGRARGYLSEVRQKLTWMRERQDDRERFRARAFERYLRRLAFEADDIKGAMRGARAYPARATSASLSQPAAAPGLSPSMAPVSNTQPLPPRMPSGPLSPLNLPSADAANDAVSASAVVLPLDPPAPDAARGATASAWLNDTIAPPAPSDILGGPFHPAARGFPPTLYGDMPDGALVAAAITRPLTISDALDFPDKPASAPGVAMPPEDADDATFRPLTVTGALPVIATGLSATGADESAYDGPRGSGDVADIELTGADAEAPDTEADPTIMPERLRRLIAQLGEQLGAEDGLLPSYGTVMSALVMLLPFLAYAAVALAPVLPWRLPVWHVGASLLPLNVVLVGVALALAVGVPTVVIYRRQAERVGRLRRLLVGAHARWWAELCGRAEDRLRREGVARLRDTVEERLAAVASFEERLRQAQVALDAEAGRLENALTAGPQGRRDIFVVGGKRFPGVRMRHLHQRIQARRTDDPLDPRHADETALGAALRACLRTDDAGLLDLSSDDIAERVTVFGAEVCRPYLTGELVAVLPAMHLGWHDHDAERVPLSTLIERATPLYRPVATDSPHRLVALAAPDDFTLRDAPETAPTLRLVTTPSPEWLMVAHLLSHGRPRWWRSSSFGIPSGPVAQRTRSGAAHGRSRSRRTQGDA